MKFIDKPKLDINARGLFELCILSYKDNNRSSLLCLSNRVEFESEEFVKQFPSSFSKLSRDEKDVKSLGLTEVYKYQFVQKSGRDYYLKLKLMSGPFCPICNVEKVKHLDHYLPKSVYHFLIFTPENLYPICHDCNTTKDDYVPNRTEDCLLHPYFDNVDSYHWLEANIQTDESVEFCISLNSIGDEFLKSRIEQHWQTYKHLKEFYETKAIQYIVNHLDEWKRIFKEEGEAELKKIIQHESRCGNKELNNTWDNAFFRALIKQFSVVLDWVR